jgi:RNA polymerase sigma-70 factor (ECF subfamily)
MGTAPHISASAPLGVTSPEKLPPAREALDFAALYREHFGFVWRCVRVLGVPAEQQDDVCQEVFVVAHRRLPEFRADSGLRTWLYGILRNVAANARRSRRRRGNEVPLVGEWPSSAAGPIENVEAREAAEFVEHFLARVGEKKREVFVLALLEGMTIPEVAEALGIPLNTAYTRLRGVRLDFQRALERRGGNDS